LIDNRVRDGEVTAPPELLTLNVSVVAPEAVPAGLLVPDVVLNPVDEVLPDERPDPASALPGAARVTAARAVSPNVARAAVLAMRFLIIWVPSLAGVEYKGRGQSSMDRIEPPPKQSGGPNLAGG
jgi:hypothetical protein